MPEENRWLVSSPEFFEQLRKAGVKLSDQSVMADGGSSQIRNGKVTDRPLFGFNMYQQMQLLYQVEAADHTFGSSGSNGVFLYGHMSELQLSTIAKTN